MVLLNISTTFHIIKERSSRIKRGKVLMNKIKSYFMEKLPACFYSSFIFLVNVFVASYYKYYLYAILFFALFITSIIYHCDYNNMTVKFIDRVAIAFVVLYGGYLFWTKMTTKPDLTILTKIFMSILILCTFFGTIYLYCYGYLTNQFCFYDDFNIACLWHSLVHCMGSFGHICIVLL